MGDRDIINLSMIYKLLSTITQPYHNITRQLVLCAMAMWYVRTVKPLLMLASWTLPLQNNFKVQNKQFQTPSTSSIFSSSGVSFALSGSSCGRLQVNHQQLPLTNLSFCDIWDMQRRRSLLERRDHPDMHVLCWQGSNRGSSKVLLLYYIPFMFV